MNQPNPEKGLPTNTDAERFVLGALMIGDGEVMHGIRAVLEPDDFALDKHRRIWAAAATVYDSGSKADRITVANELMRLGQLESCDGLTYLVSLDDGLPQLPNVDEYVKILKGKALLRRMIHAARNLEARCFANEDKPERILDSIGDTLLNLAPADSTRRGLISAGELVADSGFEALVSPRKVTGVPLPWPWMTEATCGLGSEELWVLAGGTSTGKTAAAIQAAIHAARSGATVPIFSMEVSKEALFRRAVVHMARVDKERFDRGLSTKAERERIREATTELVELPVYFDDSGAQTCPAIHAALRRLRAKRKIGLIIVDYLQLLGSSGNHSNRAQEVGSNARALKMAAKDFGCPVLLLSQFNRDPGKESRRPSLFDLKESGDIENHANGVWFIHRPATAEITNRGTEQEQVAVEFMLPKQRDGARDIAHPFYFFPRYQRFEMGGAQE